MSAPVQDFAKWGPCDYVPMPFIHPDWKMADVGPGGYPHPRANVYIDHDENTLEPLKEAGKETILTNLEDGLPDIDDDAYDFCFASHILEHCLQLQKCVDALNRISKRGMIVVPSVFKDFLFNLEEEQHIWHCLPNPTHGAPPIFVERNVAYVSRIKDQMVQKAMCFLFRTGSHHDCTTEQYLRGWYQRTEPHLDIVHHWAPGRPLKVITIR